MKLNSLILCVFLISLLVASCNQNTQTSPQTQTSPTTIPQKSGQQTSTVNEMQSSPISSDVKDLLARHNEKVKNIYYKYKGPQTDDNFYDFYIKGDRIKYFPYRELKGLDRNDSYNSVYIDVTAKTAQKYCDDRTCLYKGKKGDLNYKNSYILTMFDWLNGVTQAQKVGEEVIDDRSVWKIETNRGTLWIDTFYGIPLKIQSGITTFRFQQIAVNSVQDSDVVPPS